MKQTILATLTAALLAQAGAFAGEPTAILNAVKQKQALTETQMKETKGECFLLDLLFGCLKPAPPVCAPPAPPKPVCYTPPQPKCW